MALVMADVLLINTKTSDIGRPKGSNLSLLEVIFKVNTRIVGLNANKKKLVFALRDFSAEHDNLENLKKIFAADINKVWKKIIPTPPEIGDYFEIEFVPLSNFQH